MTSGSDTPKASRPDENEKKFEERARAYLARGETRLSTMHRVAGVFVSGAGLLTLIPFLLKDVFIEIINFIRFSNDNNWINIVSSVILFFLATTIFISCTSLFLLFKDLVLFYFSPNDESEINSYFIPRFALSALSIPLAEGENDKNNIARTNIIKDIFLAQYKQFFRFLLPKDANVISNYDIIYGLAPKIISEERNTVFNELEPILSKEKTYNKNYVIACLTALGMSGVKDRTYLEEVARLEISLARHANNLRRLVLRYFKSVLLIGIRILLIFGIGFYIKTFNEAPSYLITNISAKSSTITQQAKQLPPILPYRALLFTFLLITGISPHIMRYPLNWIHKLSFEKNSSPTSSQWDSEISQLEILVLIVTILEFVCCAYGLTQLYNLSDASSIIIVTISIAIYLVFTNHKIYKFDISHWRK